MQNYQHMTNAQLADVYNGLAASKGLKAIKGWKGKKDVLIGKIREIEDASAYAQAVEKIDAQAYEDKSKPELQHASVPGIVEHVESKEELGEVPPPRSKPALAVDNTKPKKPRVEKKERKARKVGEEDPNSVRRRALELLAQVEFYEDKDRDPGPDNRFEEPGKNRRSVGLSYYDVLATIGREWKEKNRASPSTSDACLRWYTVKVHAGEHGFAGWKLAQRRPRSLGGKGKKVIENYVVVSRG